MTSACSRPPGLLPLLVAQALAVFNDNAWKMIVIVLAGRAIDARAGLDAADREAASQTQTMAAMLALTLPLLLFSLPGGVLADRLGKAVLLRRLKAVELVLMLAGTLALWLVPDATALLVVLLALLAAQSALFSPAKYGIVPELVPHARLSSANGALEAWTFLAIIAGTLLGPVLIEAVGEAPGIAGLVLAALSLAGLLATTRIPAGLPARPGATLRDTVGGALAAIRADRLLLLAIAGATWFWLVATLLAQDLIVYGRYVLGLADGSTGLPFGAFGIGVGIGAWVAGRVSGPKVEMGLIPLGATGLGAFVLALGLIAPGLRGTLALMVLIGIASGFLIVPLDALLQWRAPADRRGAVIGVANVAVFAGMTLGALLGGVLSERLSSEGILLGAAVVTWVGTAWTLWVLPEAFLRVCAFLFTSVVYRVHLIGREHVPEEGGALLTPNHVSFVDWLFLGAMLDRRVRFVINEEQYNRPLARPLLRITGAIPIPSDGGVRGTLRALRAAGRHLEQGELVCIFPEGQITRTGELGPFKRGAERIARGTGAPIVPVHLDRLWGSIFSYSGGRFVMKLPEELPYRVTLAFGEPLPDDTPVPEIRAAVQRLGERSWAERKADRQPLHRTFVATARRRPWRFAMADKTRAHVSRFGVLVGTLALGRALAPLWRGQERVGVLLPPSVGGALVNLAASMGGRTSVNLNYTAGESGMTAAARRAELRTIVTSRLFVDRAELILPRDVEPIWLEDVRERIGALDKLWCMLLALLAPPGRLERACGATGRPGVDDVVTVIFSSGSTGEPKGVMLTHFNVDSNVEAAAQVLRLGPADRVLGILPLFHSFGFTSMWFGLNRGAPVVFHANPLDGPTIGRLVSRYRITIMLATPTFLQLYERRCTPEQFGSLRLIITGAEKLSEQLQTRFEDTFGIRPLEGYGATECSPIIAACVPSFRAPGFFQAGSRRGSVGLPLPGVAVRIVDPETFEPRPTGESGLLLVSGPNVMKGYLGRPDLTAEVLRDGWYVTGDIARVDEDGFLYITDRLSRFSKIGGEMVPHGRIEEALHAAWDGPHGAPVFAVTALPDERRGERLCVLTTAPPEVVPEVLGRLVDMGLPALYIPRKDAFVPVDEIPLLGTGKIDLEALRAIAAERMGVASG